MQEPIKVLAKILTNILTALYEPFGFSLLLSFLAMFFYLYAYESMGAGKGWKNAIVTWYQKFKELLAVAVGGVQQVSDGGGQAEVGDIHQYQNDRI